MLDNFSPNYTSFSCIEWKEINESHKSISQINLKLKPNKILFETNSWTKNPLSELKRDITHSNFPRVQFSYHYIAKHMEPPKKEKNSSRIDVIFEIEVVQHI